MLSHQLKFVILILSFALLACSNSLDEEEAMDIIKKEKKYPQLVYMTFTSVNPNSPLGNEISRLLKEGYITKQKSYWSGCGITDKGRNIIHRCTWNSVYRNYEIFSVYTHFLDILEINKILTDSKSGVAVVTYTVNYTPTPYCKLLYEIAPNILNEKSNRLVPYQITCNFQKYDQGWQFVN